MKEQNYRVAALFFERVALLVSHITDGNECAEMVVVEKSTPFPPPSGSPLHSAPRTPLSAHAGSFWVEMFPFATQASLYYLWKDA